MDRAVIPASRQKQRTGIGCKKSSEKVTKRFDQDHENDMSISRNDKGDMCLREMLNRRHTSHEVGENDIASFIRWWEKATAADPPADFAYFCRNNVILTGIPSVYESTTRTSCLHSPPLCRQLIYRTLSQSNHNLRDHPGDCGEKRHRRLHYIIHQLIHLNIIYQRPK